MVSVSLTLLAGYLSLYVCTFDLGIASYMPPILLALALVFQVWLRGHEEPVDDEIFTERSLSTVMWSLVIVVGLALTGSMSSELSVVTKLTMIQAITYSYTISVAEEQFFRGALTRYLIAKTTPALGMIGGAAIFTVYHLAVYGADAGALIYVFVAGSLLGYVSFVTGLLSPAILAHVMNNFLFFMGG